MTESIITISILGLLVGFIFSMPVAGPVSILVTSRALKGNLKYCNLITIGSAIADFIYVFAAVFGLTHFYSAYQPLIPYILLAGTIFLVYVGIKIFRTKIDPEHIEDKKHISEKVEKEHRGAFMTGFLISFFNPTLFISWLTSSFIVISTVASLGFNVGGLDVTVENSFKEIHKANKDTMANIKEYKYLHRLDSVKLVKRTLSEEQLAKLPKSSPLILSLSYALTVAAGSIFWFLVLSYRLAKNRHRININVINRIIQVLGVVLCICALLLGYKGIQMLH